MYGSRRGRSSPTSGEVRHGEGLGTNQDAQGSHADHDGAAAYAEPPSDLSANPTSLYGLAAELAGQIPSAVPGGHLPAPVARLGASRARNANNDMAASTSGRQYDERSQAASRRAQRQNQQLPAGPDGEKPYGLAAELMTGGLQQQDAFLTSKVPGPVTGRARRGLDAQLKSVARLGAEGIAASQQPSLDPFTVMEMAAKQEGLPEPDYGIVAELRNRTPPDPFESDFGLAAEVARRRERSRSPLGRPTGVEPVPGVLPPLRARRRLDPVLPRPTEESGNLADEIAARRQQEAADMAEPFSAAARNGGQADPFALADEQLKVPQELLQPYEQSQQVLPGGPVPLKADDASEASAVSGDEEEYGIAKDLGVDAETAARRRQERMAAAGSPEGFRAPVAGALPGQAEQPEPQGHRYVYDEDAGMVVTTEGGQGAGGKIARQYIEDEATGVFYKLHSRRRRLFNMMRRKEPAVVDEEEEEERGFRGRLRRTLLTITNVFNILGMFAQGLLAGFALLNFFMTYMMYNGNSMREFLRYYGPLALAANRIYYTLLVLAVIASTSRLARDKLRKFAPRFLMLHIVDWGQMLLYVVAYVASVLCTPLDDELSYEANRNPRFYELTFAKAFKRRLALWHLLNVVRTVFVGLAWILTCYQTSPYVFEATLRAELRVIRLEAQAHLKAMDVNGALGQGSQQKAP